MSGERGPVKVTITDPNTGDVLEEREVSNDFLVICAGDRYVDSAQAYSNGTQVVTIKRSESSDD